jgi:hypothetical protein
MKQIVGFYSNQLGVRGTEVAMYDYAHYNETLLGNKSIIFYNEDCPNNDLVAIEKFRSRFTVVGFRGAYPSNGSTKPNGQTITALLDHVLALHKVDAVYIIKCGRRSDGILPTVCKTLIHAVGMSDPSEKHGDRYAYASYWLSKECSNDTIPAVPHMIDLPEENGNLRQELGIPESSIVFGRNGGNDSFDLPWAKQVVAQVVNRRSDCYFLFQNTDKFYDHPRVIHLPKNSDMNYKVKFINSCDAMIHCRYIGESFGLSCGEFSIRNKPVITWNGSPERNHIMVLGDRGLYYDNPQQLFDILMGFSKPDPAIDWNCYRDYCPSKVMESFNEVFLK